MPARVLGVGVRVAAANIWTAIQTFGSGLLKLRNPAGTFTYIFKGGAIVADRDVTMPLLTGNDVIVTEGMAQTLTNKTLTAPDINGGTADALTSLAVRSTGTGAFDLKIANAEDLTVGAKTLTVQLGDADRTLILGASPSLSGTNTGDDAGVTSVTGTAPIASSGGATPAISLDDGGVTLAKMANLAQDLFIGRTTASTGVPETATITAAARTVLDDTTVAAMVNTLGGATATGTGALVRATSPALVTPTGIVKGDVGLGNVDNTSDATKDAATATLTNKTIGGANAALPQVSTTDRVAAPRRVATSDANRGPFINELMSAKLDIGDNVLMNMITVTVPNPSTHVGAIILVEWQAHTDVGRTGESGQFRVDIARLGGADTAKALAVTLAGVEQQSGGDAETLAVTWAVDTNVGAVGATQTFNIEVTADSGASGNPSVAFYARVLSFGNWTTPPAEVTMALAA